jgi:hypothetical protein
MPATIEQPRMPAVRCDELLEALHLSPWPNCTLYLIWHFMERGDVEAAAAEYRRDSDKLGRHRKLVESVIASNDQTDDANAVSVRSSGLMRQTTKGE